MVGVGGRDGFRTGVVEGRVGGRLSVRDRVGGRVGVRGSVGGSVGFRSRVGVGGRVGLRARVVGGRVGFRVRVVGGRVGSGPGWSGRDTHSRRVSLESTQSRYYTSHLNLYSK